MIRFKIGSNKVLILVSLSVILIFALVAAVFVLRPQREKFELVGEKIEFGDLLGMETLKGANIKCDVDSLESSKIAKTAYVYVAKEIGNFSVAKKFGFVIDDFTEYKKDERYYKAEGRDNNKELRIDKYGSFTYRTGIGTVKKEMTLTEKDCIDIAYNYLNEQGLWLESLNKSGSFNEEKYSVKTADGYKDELWVRGVNFFFEEDGIPVSGNARITVDINSDGEVMKVVYNYVDYTEKYEQPLLSIEEAVEMIKSGNAHSEFDFTPTDIDIDSVVLTYWAQVRSDKTTFMQPVYDFSATVCDEKGEPGSAIITVQANKLPENEK